MAGGFGTRWEIGTLLLGLISYIGVVALYVGALTLLACLLSRCF